MKTIYLVRHAKAKSFFEGLPDYERSLRKGGYSDIKMIGSYLALQDVTVDLILSSYALYAQETMTYLAKLIGFNGQSHFLKQLYYAPYEDAIKIITAQDNSINSIMLIGHNPQLNELINFLSKENISKIPTMGVVALNFETDSWADLEDKKGSLDYFIYPKQFKYYMPKQIRTTLQR